MLGLVLAWGASAPRVALPETLHLWATQYLNPGGGKVAQLFAAATRLETITV